MSDRNGAYGDYQGYRGRGYNRGYRGHHRDHYSRGQTGYRGRGRGDRLTYYNDREPHEHQTRGGGYYRGGHRGGYRGYDGSPNNGNTNVYVNDQYHGSSISPTASPVTSSSAIAPSTTTTPSTQGTGMPVSTSTATAAPGANTPVASRNRNRPQTGTNPWIHLLLIKDEHTRSTLQQRYQELEEVDARLIELQKTRLSMESAVRTLEIYAAKEALNVSITNDKLEEFTYL